MRYVDLERDIVGRIILCEHLAHKFRRVKRLIIRQVLPKELSPPDDPPLAHRE